jgi:hypothetical protein
MLVDIVNQKVVVAYSLHDSGGVSWQQGQQTYWVTMPTLPTQADSQLPTQYLQNLVNLYNASKADLEAKYLI